MNAQHTYDCVAFDTPVRCSRPVGKAGDGGAIPTGGLLFGKGKSFKQSPCGVQASTRLRGDGHALITITLLLINKKLVAQECRRAE